jgi:hypothetical protein
MRMIVLAGVVRGAKGELGSKGTKAARAPAVDVKLRRPDVLGSAGRQGAARGQLSGPRLHPRGPTTLA